MAGTKPKPAPKTGTAKPPTEEYVSPIRARRTRRSVLKNIEQGLSNETQRAPTKTKKVQKSAKTPKKSIKTSNSNPDASSLEADFQTSSTLENLVTIRQSMQTSSIPTQLPCREEQFEILYNFCFENLQMEMSSVLYVAGVPGTGKTATISKIIQTMDECEKSGEIPAYKAVYCNGMKLTSPKNAFLEIYRALIYEDSEDFDKDKPLPKPEECKIKLAEYFRNKPEMSTLLVIDELDLLQTKRQDVLYQIFDWPQNEDSKLVIIGIANTLDLPERLQSARVASRIGHARLQFKPYTKKQLGKILASRVEIAMEKINETLKSSKSTKNSKNSGSAIQPIIFQESAIQFIAMKVASVNGDARRALDAARLACDVCIEKEQSEITVQHALPACNMLFGSVGGSTEDSSASQMVMALSRVNKMVLLTIVDYLQNTGADNISAGDAWRMCDKVLRSSKNDESRGHVELRCVDGIRFISRFGIQQTIFKLCSAGLLEADDLRQGPLAKLRINLRPDDLLYALKAKSNADE